MAFKKGQTPWNKGKKYSAATCKKIGDSHKGQVPWNKGTKGLCKPNSTSFKKGDNPWNTGLPTEKQPNWRGGLSSKNHKLRQSKMYKLWREAVFLRDGFICQNKKCKYCDNIIGIYLHAHHVEAFSDNEDLRFNINNGITYCAEFHLKGGLHNGITKKQLNIGGKK